MNINQIIEFIEQSNGKIFSIKFRKRTDPNEIRKMVCRTGVTKHLTPNPTKPGIDWELNRLIGVFDMKKNQYRCIPIDGIIAIKLDDKWVEVTHNQIS